MDNIVPEILHLILLYIDSIDDLGAVGLINRHWHFVLLNAPLDIWDRVFPGLFPRLPRKKRTLNECQARIHPFYYAWPNTFNDLECESIIWINGPNQLNRNNIYDQKKILSLHSITFSHDISTNQRKIRQSEAIISGENFVIYQPNESEIRFLDTNLGNYHRNLLENFPHPSRLLPFYPSEDLYLSNINNQTYLYRTDIQFNNINYGNPIFMSAISARDKMVLVARSQSLTVELWRIEDLALSNDDTENPEGENLLFSDYQPQENPVWVFQPGNSDDPTNNFELTERFNVKGTIGPNEDVLYAFEIVKESVLVVMVEESKLKIDKINIHNERKNTQITYGIDPGVKCISLSVTQSEIGDWLLFCFLDYGKDHLKPLLFNLNLWDDDIPPRMAFPCHIDAIMPVSGSRIKVSTDGSIITYVGQNRIEEDPFFVVVDIWHQETSRFRSFEGQGIWVVSREVQRRYGCISVDFINTTRI
ncbi:hypothetical protein HK096_006872 [Nowakowskiella sp. JEL0078]|nr:hypothetical protein HK096_006872 [Nowakowskiella sp. JEL0078]